jgi:bifunctional non-homologous end joining protein LigD
VSAAQVEIDGRTLTLTNRDRVLWPRAGFTKGDLIDYYTRVAPALLPHVRQRPLTLWRYPLGVHERGFWQNECRGAPPWMRTETIAGQRFCVVDDLPSLVWLANHGTVELHPFPFVLATPESPTALVLDLDPGPGADLADACRVALRIRDVLSLQALPKTSGSAGLHLVAPLSARYSFVETKALARDLAERLAAEAPERVTARQARAERHAKVLVDWLQNDPTRSTVAPYSLRGTPWPTVSTPVTWDEVERCARERRPELLTFDAGTVLERLERHGDLFAPVVALTERIDE